MQKTKITKLTSEERSLICRAIDFSLSLDSIFKKLEDALGISPESPIIETSNKLFDDYLRLVSEKVGDSTSFISWFIFDNDYGNNELAVTFPKKKRVVSSIEDLFWVIENYRNLE